MERNRERDIERRAKHALSTRGNAGAKRRERRDKWKGINWDKLNKLFNGLDIKYEDYVYKFNLPLGITDIWNDIKFYDNTYKK